MSWFAFFFFSGQKPHLLQTAYLATTSFYWSLEFFPSFVNKFPHSFAFVFKFYCDFALQCLVFFPCFRFSFWETLFAWAFTGLRALWCGELSALIVFLWSFFFFGPSTDTALFALKKFRFFISMLMLIFWVFVEYGELGLLQFEWLVFGTLVLGERISLAGVDYFFGVCWKGFSLVNCRYFSLKLFDAQVSCFVLLFLWALPSVCILVLDFIFYNLN